MNLSRCKRRTLIDIYYKYKYKKNLPYKEGTIPFPYIKQSDCTEHQYSADWKEWSFVVLAYIEKLKEILENGDAVQLGSNLGTFELTKLKANQFVDFKKSKELGKQVKFTKNKVDNYFICSAWTKPSFRYKLKAYWKIKLNRAWVRSIYEKCEKDYTRIYKIRNTKK